MSPPDEADLRSVLGSMMADGVQRMLTAALEAEADAYVSAHAEERDDEGYRLVVRNGHSPPRQIWTGAGTVAVSPPRVNDRRVDRKTGERRRFRSSILAPWSRKVPRVSKALPALYLHGCVTGDFAPAWTALFGDDTAVATSALTGEAEQWRSQLGAAVRRPLAGLRVGPILADCIPLDLPDDRSVHHLVVVGAHSDGTVEMLAAGVACRPTPARWADLLGDLRRRGMGPPTQALGDDPGFHLALREVFPETSAPGARRT